MRKLFPVLCFLGFAVPCFAQTDYQLRPLVHWQIAEENSQGIAGWTILPDITQTNPFRMVVVAGWLLKDGQNWLEIMPGGVFGSDGSKNPVLNIRAYTRNKRTDVYSEFQIRPNLALASVFATTPIEIKGLQFRAGFEFESVTALREPVKNQALIGPRISLVVPGVPWLSVATVIYSNLKGHIIVRTYVATNIKR